MPTREEIKKAMQETRGSYVLLTPKGTFHIRTEADIPSDAELARGDPDQEARTRDDLQRQIRELQAQVRTLAPSSAPVPPEPTVNPDLGLKQGRRRRRFRRPEARPRTPRNLNDPGGADS
jgi:hypothetical protein